MKSTAALVSELIESTVEALGVQLWGVEHIQQGKFSLLRIYIESDEGIAIEDCEKVSREVAALLDVEDPIPGHYNLEISSPGLDRPLFTLEQFDRFVGEVARVSLFAPQEGQRKFKGTILGTEGDRVKIEVDGSEVQLDMNNIAKARLVPDYDKLFSQREAR